MCGELQPKLAVQSLMVVRFGVYKTGQDLLHEDDLE